MYATMNFTMMYTLVVNFFLTPSPNYNPCESQSFFGVDLDTATKIPTIRYLTGNLLAQIKHMNTDYDCRYQTLTAPVLTFDNLSDDLFRLFTYLELQYSQVATDWTRRSCYVFARVKHSKIKQAQEISEHSRLINCYLLEEFDMDYPYPNERLQAIYNDTKQMIKTRDHCEYMHTRDCLLNKYAQDNFKIILAKLK